MCRTRLVLILLLIAIGVPFLKGQQAHPKKFWVFFTDKGPDVAGGPLQRGTNSYKEAEAGLSQRAMDRRAKVLPPEDLIDAADLPTYRPYIDAIVQDGGILVHDVHWFNAASFHLDERLIPAIRKHSFVKNVKPVAVMRGTPLPPPEDEPVTDLRKQAALDYGPSLNQVQMIRIPPLHDFGINGTTVLIGMLDTGFRWRDHEALSSRRILAERDFIFGDGTTANEGNDRADQDIHGTLTLSVVGGFMPGRLIGPAYGSDFILSKTEDVRSETRVEEDNWAAAIIWMEGQGIDVASSSLGYNMFDGGGGYSWENGDFNGRTSITALAAARAARMGVVICTAMGNEGNGDGVVGTMLTPADADSIISVGAVTFGRRLAGFSSTGPTNDGRTKPDLVAPGVGVYYAAIPGPNTYGFQQGTSLATPLAAGAAAVVLSARPELSPVQVRNVLRATADTIDVSRTPAFPNDSTGWGLVNALRAVLSFGPVFSNIPAATVEDSVSVISTSVVSQYGLIPQSVQLRYRTEADSAFAIIPMTLDSSMMFPSSGRYRATIPPEARGTLIHFAIEAADSAGNAYATPPPVRRTEWRFRYGQPGVDSPPRVPTDFTLLQNYPNPFPNPGNPVTTIRYTITREERVHLAVYNLLGQLVVTLVDQVEAPGSKSVFFDGASLPSGVYFYRLSTPSVSLDRKMLLVR